MSIYKDIYSSGWNEILSEIKTASLKLIEKELQEYSPQGCATKIAHLCNQSICWIDKKTQDTSSQLDLIVELRATLEKMVKLFQKEKNKDVFSEYIAAMDSYLTLLQSHE